MFARLYARLRLFFVTIEQRESTNSSEKQGRCQVKKLLEKVAVYLAAVSAANEPEAISGVELRY